MLNLNTSELRQGDIVHSHGMRLLIDGELHTDQRERLVYWTQALVTNRNEVPNEVVPFGWTADWKRTGWGEARPHNGEHRWTIQGNDLARWYVER